MPIESQIGPIGLGTFAMGGADWKASWGPQDDQASIATIHQALDAGISWIDTAPAYGLGVAETVLGKALAERSEKPFIATKLGRCWNEQRQLGSNLDPDSIRQECEDSLRRLGVDVIDLYQIHWPIPDEGTEDAWSTVAELKQTGKIRYAGVSNFSVEQLKRCQPILPIDTLQSPLSLLQPALLETIIPYCREQNIQVLAYSPMQKGLLLGKVSPSWVDSLSSDDHRKNDPLFQEPRLRAINQQVEAAKELAESKGLTLQQVVVGWTTSIRGVAAAILGCRTPEQAQAAAACQNIRLDAETITAVEQIFGVRQTRE
jgi:aryl-alcohol dehydrogenase-like predicted oxidoreductase